MSEAAAPANHMASLYKKLAAVMGAMKRVPKEGWNDFHKYHYATAADVADVIRAALSERDIAFFAEMLEAEIVDGVWVAVFEFTFADGETGAVITKRWRGEAQATTSKGGRDDKGLNKAATAAEKYFLLKTFIVSTGDEPDPDADGEQPASKRKPADADGENRSGRSATFRKPPEDKPQMGFNPPQPWTVEQAIAWANAWGDQGLTQSDLLEALKVSRLGEWKQGQKAATDAVNTYLDKKLSGVRS